MDVITLATAKKYTDDEIKEIGNTNNQSGAGIPHIELTANPLGELPSDFCSFLDEQLEKRQPFSCTFTLLDDEYGTTMIMGGCFMLGIMLYEGEVEVEAFFLPNGNVSYGFAKTDGVWTFMIDHGE